MGWRLARSLVTLRDEVQTRYPGTTVWTVADEHHPTSSDHHPNNPRHPGVVTAIDVVGRDKASRLTGHLVRHRDHRIKYLIFDGRIISSTVSPWQWRTYSGSNAHRDHVHISVHDDAAHYDNPSSWGFADHLKGRYNMLVYAPGKPDAEAVAWAEEYVRTVPGVVTRSESEARAAVDRKETVVAVGVDLPGASRVLKGSGRIATLKLVVDYAAKGWK